VTRQTPSEAGFTLVELLVCVMILGVIIFPLSAALYESLGPANGSTTTRFVESHDAQLVSVFLPEDVKSSTSVTNGGTGCSPAGTNVLTLSWAELLPATGPVPATFTAAYQIQKQGADWRLYRYYCNGTPPTVVASQVVADNLQGPSAGVVTLNPPTPPSTVSLKLTEQSGFSYTVSGTERA
jgi:prepilin-type N-terminal cleavage/methylation domain-containing protein